MKKRKVRELGKIPLTPIPYFFFAGFFSSFLAGFLATSLTSGF
jgi:hypothetical protein